jgi:hypothetical protein
MQLALDSPRGRDTRTAIAAALLLAAFAAQASLAARRDSVTIDEFAHLPVGLHLISSGDFRVDPINPPLARMVFALPLLAADVSAPGAVGEGPWRIGGKFMRSHFLIYHRLFVRSRHVAIAVALALGVVVFAWARALYDRRAALLALLLFGVSPSMLAHGHLVTLDVAGALGTTLTLFLFWRFLAGPGPAGGLAVGASAGIALLCKLSSAVLAPALLASLVVQLSGSGRRAASPARWLGSLALVPAAALVVVNLGYGFTGLFQPLGGASFLAGGALAGLQAALPGLRLPLPLPLLEGVDLVTHGAVARTEYFFLLGELSTSGWWYYHLVAFLVKTPIPLLLLSLLAVARWASRRPLGRREHCLFLPLILLFAANALFNSQNIGVRHVLAAYPLLFIAASPLLAGALGGLREQWRRRRLRPATVGALLALAWFVVSSLAVAPRYLQYFNELAGGPEKGHRVLIDSNLDWGQDLIRLKDYMDASGIDRVALAYFGRVHPHVYGIDFVPLERETSQGVAVVSASFLMGRPYYWFHRGRQGMVPPNAYGWLRDREPSRRIGSLFVYELP